MNFKNKLLTLFLFTLFIIPNFTLAYSNKVILGGESIGIEVKSKNIIIVGFYEVNGKYIAKESGFKIGDVIKKINNKEINNLSDISKYLQEESKIIVQRGIKEKEITLHLVKDNTGVYKTGLYVKDKISGIGTLTYIDPSNNIFGALGHEIDESSTKEKVEVKNGKIFYSNITGIKRSSGGNPGEKNATFNSNEVYGIIKKNEISGIFGKYTKEYDNNNLIEVAEKNEVHEGKAYIKTVINKNNVEEFEIDIKKIDNTSSIKNILFEVTDERLVEKTNGIVSGMSGSPIIQDNKIVAAVTHVVVREPIKGYAIFITTMLEEGEKK